MCKPGNDQPDFRLDDASVWTRCQPKFTGFFWFEFLVEKIRDLQVPATRGSDPMIARALRSEAIQTENALMVRPHGELPFWDDARHFAYRKVWLLVDDPPRNIRKAWSPVDVHIGHHHAAFFITAHCVVPHARAVVTANLHNFYYSCCSLNFLISNILVRLNAKPAEMFGNFVDIDSVW